MLTGEMFISVLVLRRNRRNFQNERKAIRMAMQAVDEAKYDRQLRLWGLNGQQRLQNSHILLVNADATGSETLKNLVLPGVGNIAILDDTMVTADDLGQFIHFLHN